MFSFFAVVLTIIAFGLITKGSIWSIPVLILALAAWALADKVKVDVEVLGGVFLIIIVVGGAYSMINSLFF